MFVYIYICVCMWQQHTHSDRDRMYTFLHAYILLSLHAYIHIYIYISRATGRHRGGGPKANAAKRLDKAQGKELKRDQKIRASTAPQMVAWQWLGESGLSSMS